MKVKKISMTIGIALIVLIAAIWGISVAAEIMEMREIGYDIVFFKNIETRTITQLIATAVIFLVFAVNSYVVQKIMIKKGSDLPLLKNTGGVLRFCFIISLIVGIFAGGALYSKYMTYINHVPFGKVDPIFGQDIGYYVFKRPFLSAVCRVSGGLMIFQIIYLVLVYVITYAQKDIDTFKNIIYEKNMIIHVIINIFVYFAIKVCSYRFSMEDILYGEFSGLTGAGFTENFVWLRYFKIMPFLILTVAVLTLIFMFRGKMKAALWTIISVPAFWLITLAVSGVLQLVFVNPYEISMEKEYMTYNIEATKAAFGLDKINEKQFKISNDLTAEDLKSNRDIIDNIRITDINSTLVATNSIQGLRSFYTFNDNDITVYDIAGKKTAVNIGVREFDEKKLQETSKSYINEHMRYTHGYGIVMNAVSEVTDEGQPDYLIKDIPLVSADGAPKVTQPRIYFGEKTDEYAIVNSAYKELDYMDGDKNIEFSYDGKAGIKMTPLNRIIFAVKNADPMLLLSGYINSDTRLLQNRNILDRVTAVAPFLEFDADPYIVITGNGELKWVIDGYTKTSYYPYAQRYENINYIRNSVKAVVDAYDGSVTFYITDPSEPIIMMYNKMYPGLFSTDELPADIKAHTRYSERLFKIQAEVYKRYHVTQPETFYSNSDMWVTAREKYMDKEPCDVEPYYNLMPLEGEHELVLMLPFTPQGKENLVSWMAGGVGGDITVYTFPKGKTVYGTLHIENKIDNDPSISKEISLWNQGGSSVIKGNLLVIPVKNSLLYVEPIYITTKNTAAIPEVKRIVVAYGENVCMAENIDAALAQLFEKGAQMPEESEPEKPDEQEEPTDSSKQELINAIVEKYKEAKEYNASGEFEKYGKALSELDKAVAEYEEYITGTEE